MEQITIDLPDGVTADMLDIEHAATAFYEGMMLGINIPVKHHEQPEPEKPAHNTDSSFALDGSASGEVTMVLDITRADTGEIEQVTLTGRV
jgi:hypothetical protein